MNDEPLAGLNVSFLPAPAWPTRSVPPRFTRTAASPSVAASAPARREQAAARAECESRTGRAGQEPPS